MPFKMHSRFIRYDVGVYIFVFCRCGVRCGFGFCYRFGLGFHRCGVRCGFGFCYRFGLGFEWY